MRLSVHLWQMNSNSKRGHRLKRIDVYDSWMPVVNIWGSINLLFFKVVLDSFSAPVSTWYQVTCVVYSNIVVVKRSANVRLENASYVTNFGIVHFELCGSCVGMTFNPWFFTGDYLVHLLYVFLQGRIWWNRIECLCSP